MITDESEGKRMVRAIRMALGLVMLSLCLMMAILFLVLNPPGAPAPALSPLEPQQESLVWTAPDSTAIPQTPEGDLIRYGRELVAHTALYLGPQGRVALLSNGMNCQNCHLQAGKKLWGNNYSAVAANYPKHRDRSGSIEQIEHRVNDCLQRSLNGAPLAWDSKEMQAFVSYIRWVGKDVPRNVTPDGAGVMELPFLNTAADPALGKVIYAARCSRCHGSEGKGVKKESSEEWLYPPVWGPDSYNTAAGLFRLSRLAGYVKVNMPYDVRTDSAELTDEEAWHVAAFINSQPRPVRHFSSDWPDIRTKPVDHPFGPYADSFTESQHKYGPFGPILEARKRQPTSSR